MDDKELSAEDLREKLFHTFQSRGVYASSVVWCILINYMEWRKMWSIFQGCAYSSTYGIRFGHTMRDVMV